MDASSPCSQPIWSHRVRPFAKLFVVLFSLLSLLGQVPVQALARASQTVQTQDTGLLSPNPLITYVNFTFAQQVRNTAGITLPNAILVKFCIAADYHWMTSAEIAPSPIFLGKWDYGAINNCIPLSLIPAYNVSEGTTIEVGIGASNTKPQGSLAGTDYYRITRTGTNTIVSAYHHSANGYVPPPPAVAGEVCPVAPVHTMQRVPLVRGKPAEIIGLPLSDREGISSIRPVYEGTRFWLAVGILNRTTQYQNIEVTFTIRWATGVKVMKRSLDLNGSEQAIAEMLESDAIATEGLVRWNNGVATGSINIQISTNRCSKPLTFSVPVKPRPVILVHGFADKYSIWNTYVNTFQSMGVDAYAANNLDTGSWDNPTLRTNSIAVNSAALWEFIRGVQYKTGAASVDLMGHSMGGLISRYYIHAYMPTSPPIVRQLIMLGTPNGGSPFAEPLVNMKYFLPASMELTPHYMNAFFNPRVTDRYGVVFRLVAGNADKGNPALPGPDDGIVQVSSTRAIQLDEYRIIPWIGGVVPPTVHTLLANDPAIFERFVKDLFITVPRSQSTIANDTPLETSQHILDLTTQRVASDPTAFAATYEHHIVVDDQAMVSFNFYISGSDASITLRDPSGSLIDVSAQGRNISDTPLLPDYSYVVTNPTSGEWTAIITPNAQGVRSATNEETSSTVFVLAEDDAANKILKAQIPREAPVSTSMLLSALLESEEELADVQVQALITSPSGQQRTITMNTLDGWIYQTTVPLSEEGIYTALISASGKRSSKQFKRVDTTTITATPNTPSCDLKIEGDADCNDSIDLLDFSIFRDEYLGHLTTKQADFNNDSEVSLVDFEIFRQGYIKQRSVASNQSLPQSVERPDVDEASITASFGDIHYVVNKNELVEVDIFLEGTSNLKLSAAAVVLMYSQDLLEYYQGSSNYASSKCKAYNDSKGYPIGNLLKAENDASVGRVTIARATNSNDASLPTGKFCAGTIVLKPKADAPFPSVAQVALDTNSYTWEMVGPQAELIPQFDQAKSVIKVEISSVAMPSDLRTTSATKNSIALAWEDNSSNEDGFNIYRWNGAAGEWQHLTSVNPNVTYTTDSSLYCGWSYFYRISSFNSNGESSQTDWIDAKTSTCPDGEQSPPQQSGPPPLFPPVEFTEARIYLPFTMH